jgi:hypothetical protein
MAGMASIVADVCISIERGGHADAAALLVAEYPFTPLANVGRRYTPVQSMRVFARDGFIDRYSGERLVFPGTLRLLSIMMPAEFPFHTNWKTDACHFAFYELFPTIDHHVPVSRGGADSEANWVSTSMLRNAAKANFTIQELGWHLLPPADLREWDGLTGWFIRQYEGRDDLRASVYLRGWAAAAKRTMGTL